MAKRKRAKYTLQDLKPGQLLNNSGQIKGLPKNPRFIRDKGFQDMVKSMKDDPEMSDIRELVVYPHGNKFVIVAGNMRYRAMVDLKWTDIPCKILDKKTTAKKLRAYAIKDNVHVGNDDWSIYENEWSEYEDEGWAKIRPFQTELDNKGSTIRVTIVNVKEDDRDAIKQVLTKAGYKVK